MWKTHGNWKHSKNGWTAKGCHQWHQVPPEASHYRCTPGGHYWDPYCLTSWLITWVMGLSTLPASHSEEPWQAGEMSNQESQRWAKESENLGKNNPMHQYRPGADQLAEKDTKMVTSHRCALAAKTGDSLLVCVRKSTASKAREVILPLCSAPTRHSWSDGSSFGLPSRRQTRAYSEGPQRWLSDWSIWQTRRETETIEIV